jgi:hypothetical protein
MTNNPTPPMSWQQLHGAFTDAVADAAREALKAFGRATDIVRAAYDEGVPSGWQDLTTPQMRDVLSLMAETGWCLTSSPPAGTLVKLLEAPTETERGALLLAAEAQILNDLDIELRTTRTDQLENYARAVREAWEAHAVGLFMASQALSATTIAALSHGRGPISNRTLRAARTWLETFDVDEAGLREIRFYAVARAVGTALASFRDTGPLPPGFNRHATAHAITADHYTQLNSLTGLMLACGWLREVSWFVRQAAARAT